MTLVEFLLARITEDEAVARGLQNATVLAGQRPNFYGAGGPAAEDFWRRFDPAWVLAECEAKRRIVDEHGIDYEDGEQVCAVCRAVIGNVPYPCRTLRFAALPYAGHSDYREEWRP